MKKGFNILLTLCAALVAISCNKTKSYTDMLKDEEKAVERFINGKGLEVLDDFLADSVSKESRFVLLDNGVYLNTIDKGNGRRTVQYKTKVLYRCKMSYFTDSTIVAIENYGPHSNGTSPIASTYGDYSENSPYDPSYYYVSEGMQEPLKYVRDWAKVRMIVPFKRGAHNDQSNGRPVYYEILEYILGENLRH